MKRLVQQDTSFVRKAALCHGTPCGLAGQLAEAGSPEVAQRLFCRPEDPPSASDVAIDSICEYALEGYGKAANRYRDPEVASEKDRKRRVRKAKAKMQDNHQRNT